MAIQSIVSTTVTPDPWWTEFRIGYVTSLSFNVAEQYVTVGGMLRSYPEPAWDHEASVSAAQAEELGVTVDEAFIYSQLIYGLQEVRLHDRAGVRINRAWDAVSSRVYGETSHAPDEIRALVADFLEAYRPVRNAARVRYAVMYSFREGAPALHSKRGGIVDPGDPDAQTYSQYVQAERKMLTLSHRGHDVAVVTIDSKGQVA